MYPETTLNSLKFKLKLVLSEIAAHPETTCLSSVIVDALDELEGIMKEVAREHLKLVPNEERSSSDN